MKFLALTVVIAALVDASAALVSHAINTGSR
jgi:hypothetical protein